MLSNSRKGINPLRASALLIAFPIAIGIWLSGFFRDLATEQADEIKEQATPACQFAQINIDNPTWDNTTVPATLRMTISSTGTRDLEIRGLTVLYDSNENFRSVKGNFSKKTVEAGDAISMVVTEDTDGQNISNHIDIVLLVTECPNQNIEIENSEIRFIN